MKTRLQFILLSLLFVSLSVSAGNVITTGGGNDEEIDLWGDFPITGTRSLVSLPFAADVADGVLSVYARLVVGNITVSLSSETQTCFSTPMTITSPGQIVSYSLDNLPAGTYNLEIRNQQGGYLRGIFMIE